MRRLVLISLLLSACAPVRSVWLRGDWETTQADQVKRIQVFVAPLPAQREDLGALWATMTKEYINEHLDFLVYSARWDANFALKAACVAPLEGILLLRPKTEERGKSIWVAVEAELYSCQEDQPLWKVSAQLSAKRSDPLFKATAGAYAERFGEPVRDHVASSFRLLQRVADRLPKPRLTETDIDEKIDLD